MQKKYHVKKGDEVQVISGKWKGEDAKILAVLKKKDRVVLEMPNLSPQRREEIGKRTVRKTSTNPQGGLIERSISVHVSNVKLKKAN